MFFLLLHGIEYLSQKTEQQIRKEESELINQLESEIQASQQVVASPELTNKVSDKVTLSLLKCCSS